MVTTPLAACYGLLTMSRVHPVGAALRRAMALSTVMVVTLGLGAISSDASPSADPAATLTAAHSARVAAERRLDQLRTEQTAVSAELAELSEGAAQVASDLAATERELRSAAVAAYLAGGDEQQWLAFMGAGDLAEQSSRMTLAGQRVADTSEIVERLAQLKADNDPKLVALSARADRLSVAVEQAESAVLQAGAHEADAEREVAAAAAREAAAQAEREAAQRAAQARQSATTAPRQPPSPGSGTGSKVPAVTTSAPAANPRTVNPSDAPSGPLPAEPEGLPSEDKWAALRKCESGGNYRAISPSGAYRGAYQFDRRTWAGLGGTGDPAAAPPYEQDLRAKVLYSQRGARPWPVCGRFLA